MKGAGMVVVALRGVNFGFWSHLGCSVSKTPQNLAVKVSFRVTREEIKKYYIFLIRFIYSFRGQKKLGLRPDWSPSGV